MMMQADERGITPQFFLPYGRKDRSSGWLKHNLQVRHGETPRVKFFEAGVSGIH
jgi:hypothetical protein